MKKLLVVALLLSFTNPSLAVYPKNEHCPEKFGIYKLSKVWFIDDKVGDRYGKIQCLYSHGSLNRNDVIEFKNSTPIIYMGGVRTRWKDDHPGYLICFPKHSIFGVSGCEFVYDGPG